MADLILRDLPQQLWYQIEQLHLSYLQSEEKSEKLDERRKLEGVIKEFVSLVPHNQKFRFRETANVLHRSASTKKDFSAYGGAAAWNSLAMYASNLLSQPWRKEYREMELYCGFYKHEIEANLVGAEAMLEEMGYKHTGQMTMVMEWPFDPDRVKYVSQDSIVAYVECQLMKRIWEQVAKHFNCSWLEILEYRENHIGSWDQALQGLMYRFQHRQYQEYQQKYQDVYGTGRFAHQPTYGQVPQNYCNYGTYGGLPSQGYPIPMQSPYSVPQQPVMAPMPYAMPSPIHPAFHHIATTPLKPHDIYPTNGYHHQGYTASSSIVQPIAPQNGYSTMGHHVPMTSYGYSVPTAQLIELDAATPPQSSGSDAPQINSTTDSSSPIAIRAPASKQPRSTATKPRNQVVETPPEKAKDKDDGTGTFGSWDYVYRNLESQGYNKDLGERPDVLSPRKASATLPNLSHEIRNNQKKIAACELEETLMEMRLEEFERKGHSSQPENKALKFNEALYKIRLEGDGQPAMTVKKQGASDVMDGCESVSVYDNMPLLPKEKPTSIVPSKPSSVNRSNRATTKTLPREPPRLSLPDKRETKYSSTTLDSRRLDRPKPRRTTINSGEIDNFANEKTMYKWSHDTTRPRNADLVNEVETDTAVTRLHEDETLENNNCKWECITCTYLNAAVDEICDMCGKSKNLGPETRPLASGGRECPKCTLVNEKGVSICEVCGTNLKDSPTYI